MLTKRYGRARGIEGLSFRVSRGEVFGFLGPVHGCSSAETCVPDPVDAPALIGFDGSEKACGAIRSSARLLRGPRP
jgi:hypothetical protein